MSISDCSQCWETPCRCGYEYRNWSEEDIIKFINNVLKYHNKESILEKLNSK